VEKRTRSKSLEEKLGVCVCVCFACFDFGFYFLRESKENIGTMLGKPKNVENISNDLEVDELANFAVTQHNSQTVSLFVSLVFLMHLKGVV
jgi:hypothetical protein